MSLFKTKLLNMIKVLVGVIMIRSCKIDFLYIRQLLADGLKVLWLLVRTWAWNNGVFQNDIYVKKLKYYTVIKLNNFVC